MQVAPNAQSGIRCFVYNGAEQAMLDLLHKEVIRESLDAHKEKLFDTNVAANRLSQRLLISKSFMAPIATFLRRKSDTTMEQ